MSNVKKENPKLSHWGSKKKKIRVKGRFSLEG